MAYQANATRSLTPRPEMLGRKGKGRMPKDDFEAAIAHAISESVQYVDGELSPERAIATRYYAGKSLGNEEEGRSQVVLTEVRDAVMGMLPSLLRVFHGPEHAVEFVPKNADAVEQAAQKTDYVRYVFEEDNAGFLKSHAVLKDGLVKKLGIFKWGWEGATTKAFKQEGISREELDLLAAKDAVEFTRVAPRDDGTYDVEFTHTDEGRARIWEIPPEEFIFNRRARSGETALLVGHRTEKTRGELIAMGVDEKVIEEHGGPGDENTDLRGNPEELARKDAAAFGSRQSSGDAADPPLGTANDKILYCEVFVTIDYDGDGVAELRRICTIGHGYYPVENNPADERPFAMFTPDPEPHALLGGSIADRTMDVQKINSAILRSVLDSLSASIFPRLAYVEGQASVADIMNNAIGAPMRERAPGMIRAMEVPFVGKEAMPILGFMKEVIESRTGQNKGVVGLDDDALQSTGAEAVDAVLTSSQAQIEMIARVYAEMTLKPLFRGVAKLIAKHKPKARMVKLRGAWVPVDPATWDDGVDVTVNVALGSTFTDKKIQTLMLAAQDQKEIITTMGLSNPLVSLPMFRNTRAKILELRGIKNTKDYYNELPANWQPPPPQPPQPSPDQLWIQAEKEMNHTKTMKELAIKADTLAFEREKFAAEQAAKQQEAEMKFALEKYKADLQYAADKEQSELDRKLEEDRAETELTMAAHRQVHEIRLQEDKQEHEKEMATRAADTADKQAAKSEASE